MSKSNPANSVGLVSLCVLGSLWLFGCGKPAAEVAPPPAVVESAPQPATTTTPSLTEQNVQAQAAWADARLKEAQAAQQSRDYEKAAQALVALQQQQRLSEAQAAAYANQMRLFQRDLAGAVASGDPRAKAAADRLRQASMAR